MSKLAASSPADLSEQAEAQRPVALAADRVQPGIGSLSRPLGMFSWLLLRQRPGRSVCLILTAACGIGLMGFEPILIKALFDLLQTVSVEPEAGRAGALTLLGWIALVWVASFLMNRLREWIESRTAPEVRQAIQEFLLSWAMAHSAGFFRERFAGALAQSI